MDPYRKLALYYDRIYHGKDYRTESASIAQLIRRHTHGKELLDVGCGTGQHLVHLRKQFRCTGVDASAAMLAVARKKVKGARFHKGDMRTFSLRKKFDALVCLFSGIGYLRSDRELVQAFRNFLRHLRPGGVCLVEPWLSPRVLKAGRPHMVTYDNADLKMARLNVSERKKDLSVLDMHHLIAERRTRVRYLRSRHELRMVGTPKLLQLMRRAGLRARFLRRGLTGRGLLVGTKP